MIEQHWEEFYNKGVEEGEGTRNFLNTTIKKKTLCLSNNAQFFWQRTVEEHNALLDRIKSQVKCFKCNSDVERYDKLRNLKEHLHYGIARTTYEGCLTSAVITVDELRKKHVDAELLKFDMA